MASGISLRLRKHGTCPHTDFPLPPFLPHGQNTAADVARLLCAHCHYQLCDLHAACHHVPLPYGGWPGACGHKGNNSSTSLGTALYSLPKHSHLRLLDGVKSSPVLQVRVNDMSEPHSK
jgi:hypothetical protein